MSSKGRLKQRQEAVQIQRRGSSGGISAAKKKKKRHLMLTFLGVSSIEYRET